MGLSRRPLLKRTTMPLCRSSIFTLLAALAAMAVGTSCASQMTERIDEEHSDKMRGLPGFNQPLPSAWYSGYLDYEFESRQIHTHYVLVRAEDDDDHKKPLIYWSNGGPGASSLYGLLTELGPLVLSDLSLNTPEYKETGIPTPIYNPYSWARLGSILIFDQPAPVGFSYCNDSDTSDPSSNSCDGLAWTDELASQNVYLALQEFYKTHSSFQDVDLYLTGESYAGIYVPTLARRIFEDTKSKIALKGFAVGDGCLGTHTDLCGGLFDSGFVDYWHVIFMAGHHQIPLSTFHKVMNACVHRSSHGAGEDNYAIQDDSDCKAAMKEAKKELGGFFEYSLYDDCTYRNGLLRKQQALGLPLATDVSGALNDYPCGGGVVLEEYLKLDSVKESFHVRSNFFEVDNAEGFDYTPTERDLTGFYKQINGKLKVLIYNGDTDPAITSFAAQNWTSHLGFEADQPWRPWTVDNCQRMGGYVVRYKGNFDFLTIRGAGHMVPTNKPKATFTYIKAWIDGTDYPAYDPTCEQPSVDYQTDSGKYEQMIGWDGTTLAHANEESSSMLRQKRE